MARPETFSLASQRDGTELRALWRLPEGEPRAIVQFSHGMCEHKERYIPFLEFLADHGYACVIHDHRGHGEAAREKGELGYFGEDGARALVDDLHQMTLAARERFPGLRLYLFGHSMGSLAVRDYAARFEDELSGLIVCGSPAWNPGAPVARRFARLSGRLCGARKRSGFFKTLTFAPFYRAFAGEGGKCAWICSDKEVVRAYESSPLCGFTFTHNGFEALYALMLSAYDTRARAQNARLPILFISGENDPCRGGDKGFEYAVNRMLRRGYENVGGRVYAHMRHEILNEVERQTVWNDVLETLDGWEAEA